MSIYNEQTFWEMLYCILDCENCNFAYFFFCSLALVGVGEDNLNIILNMTVWNQECNFVRVCENQTWLQPLQLLKNSMREVDSHMWMLRESIRESILWFLSNLQPHETAQKHMKPLVHFFEDILRVYTEHTLLVVTVCLQIFLIRVSCINTTR